MAERVASVGGETLATNWRTKRKLQNCQKIEWSFFATGAAVAEATHQVSGIQSPTAMPTVAIPPLRANQSAMHAGSH